MGSLGFPAEGSLTSRKDMLTNISGTLLLVSNQFIFGDFDGIFDLKIICEIMSYSVQNTNHTSQSKPKDLSKIKFLPQ